MSRQTERIGRMVGKSTYRDLRDGFTAGSLIHDSDVDIKIALGFAQHNAGELPVSALITHFAGTLCYERMLLGAWDRARREQLERTAHMIAIDRMAASLAIRHFAGASGLPVADVPHYAWLVRTRRENLQEQMGLCRCWLDEKCQTGVDAFLDALSERRKLETTARRRVAPVRAPSAAC